MVVGRYDYIAPVEFSEEIAQAIPLARLEVFEHSGHNPSGDEPDKWRDTVLSFLKTHIL